MSFHLSLRVSVTACVCVWETVRHQVQSHLMVTHEHTHACKRSLRSWLSRKARPYHNILITPYPCSPLSLLLVTFCNHYIIKQCPLNREAFTHTHTHTLPTNIFHFPSVSFIFSHKPSARVVLTCWQCSALLQPKPPPIHKPN